MYCTYIYYKGINNLHFSNKYTLIFAILNYVSNLLTFVVYFICYAVANYES